VGKFLIQVFLCINFNTSNEQFGNPFQLNFSRFLPDVFARWDLKKSENLTYNYTKNGFNDINALVEGYIFTNF
jgi:hypothetical protein